MPEFPPSTPTLPEAMVTTALELAGYRIVRNIGVVRGIVVRSRSIIGTIGAALQTIGGGNITLFTELCEKTRRDAFGLMAQHAAAAGANAIVAARYDANEMMQGVTEVLATGRLSGWSGRANRSNHGAYNRCRRRFSKSA